MLLQGVPEKYPVIWILKVFSICWNTSIQLPISLGVMLKLRHKGGGEDKRSRSNIQTDVPTILFNNFAFSCNCFRSSPSAINLSEKCTAISKFCSTGLYNAF